MVHTETRPTHPLRNTAHMFFKTKLHGMKNIVRLFEIWVQRKLNKLINEIAASHSYFRSPNSQDKELLYITTD